MTVAEYNICVDKFSDGIFRFILKNSGSDEKAKDIVQDTFEKLWIKVDTVSYGKAKSYLFTTAYHTFIDSIRKEKYRGDSSEIDKSRLSHNEQYSDLSEVLEDALKRLPDIQRSVLLLRDYEGYSYEEIAEITNLSDAQVKVYIYRARLTLKEYLKSVEAVL
jgi:RNA polymerase sigma factor (sigma-70 family)